MREFIPRRLQSFKFLTPFLSVRVWQKTHFSKAVAVTAMNGWAWASGLISDASPGRSAVAEARALVLLRSLAAQAWPSGWNPGCRGRGGGVPPWSEALLQRSPPRPCEERSPGCTPRHLRFHPRVTPPGQNCRRERTQWFCRHRSTLPVGAGRKKRVGSTRHVPATYRSPLRVQELWIKNGHSD